MRGLKRLGIQGEHNERTSHALRVRGLKLMEVEMIEKKLTVARSTRAWIETTSELYSKIVSRASHALRVRGLKHYVKKTNK